MRKFTCFISNGNYSVGCSGQTVWVYDAGGALLAKFRDLIYAYDAAFSPKGDIFVVKTTDGRLGVYGLEPPRLIKKFRFSKVDYSQDDNFCFSPDGERLYNIERQESSLHSVLSVYRTDDFSLEKRYAWYDTGIEVTCVECDSAADCCYLTGCIRDKSGVCRQCFVARLADDVLADFKLVPDHMYNIYNAYKRLESRGFTEQEVERSILSMESYQQQMAEEHCTLEELRGRKASLAELWQRYPLATAEELERMEPIVLSEEETKRIAEDIWQIFYAKLREFGIPVQPDSLLASKEPTEPLS